MITPEQADVIQEAIDSTLLDVHTALPASVVVYNPATRTAEVELQTKRVLEKEDGTLTTEILPVLVNVPVAIWRSTLFYQDFFLAPGDHGMVLFSETSLDQWRSLGVLCSPADIERHGLSGGVFVPILSPLAKTITDVLTQGAVFGAVGGFQMRCNLTGIEITSGGLPASVGGSVAMATLVLAELVKIGTAITGLGGSYTPPLPPPLGLGVHSTNLKAD